MNETKTLALLYTQIVSELKKKCVEIDQTFSHILTYLCLMSRLMHGNILFRQFKEMKKFIAVSSLIQKFGIRGKTKYTTKT